MPPRAKSPVTTVCEGPREAFRSRIIKEMQNKFTKIGGSVDVASEMVHLHQPTGYVSTGLYGLDAVLSLGKGIPYGRFIEIFAPEGAGKSALAEYLMSRFHQVGGLVHHIDTEMTRDDDRIESCYGLSRSDFLSPDLPDLESVWDYAYGVVCELSGNETTLPNLIVLDSLAATPSRDELEEKEHNAAHVGLQARASSKGVRKTVRRFASSSAVFIFINQLRDKIGAMGYGPKTDTPGGRALKYAYSIRMKLAKIKTLKTGDSVVGHLVQVTTVKNKHAPPQLNCELYLSYSRGIDASASNFMWFQANKHIIGSRGNFQWVDAKGKCDIPNKFQFHEWADQNHDRIQDAQSAIIERLRVVDPGSGDDATSDD